MAGRSGRKEGKAISDAIRRGIRTFVQAFTGVIVAQAAALAVSVDQGTYVPDVNWLKRLGISAVVAGVIAVVSWVHNATEDAGVIPSVLKATPSGGKHPVTHDPAR